MMANPPTPANSQTANLPTPANSQTANPFPELEQLRQRAIGSQDRVEKLRLAQEWIDKAKHITAQGEGQIKQLELQRTQEYGVPDDAQAQEMILELRQDVARLDQELTEGTQGLMEEMGWVI